MKGAGTSSSSRIVTNIHIQSTPKNSSTYSTIIDGQLKRKITSGPSTNSNPSTTTIPATSTSENSEADPSMKTNTTNDPVIKWIKATEYFTLKEILLPDKLWLKNFNEDEQNLPKFKENCKNDGEMDTDKRIKQWRLKTTNNIQRIRSLKVRFCNTYREIQKRKTNALI